MNSPVHPLRGANAFKLGVFSANADGGLAITDVPERWSASWDDNLTAAGIADRAGLEFFLPIARWKGFGGKNRVREWSFETFAWAAGLAAVTQRIGIFKRRIELNNIGMGQRSMDIDFTPHLLHIKAVELVSMIHFECHRQPRNRANAMEHRAESSFAKHPLNLKILHIPALNKGNKE